ncbi:MAG: hypothetical protein ACYC4T_12215 [Melioribacteraceae bacterium]
MDKRIRKNEICIIGLPRCDYVFSSTRSCFIAYGFEDSPLEMNILKAILESKDIECVEAGGKLAPAQSAFCAKICSKIITSQFCIVLLNNREEKEIEIPNANVNMEYGLMLAFNKYVIPFQRKEQKLPFNVAGLDTIKYTNNDFKRLVEEAIEDAIEKTKQETPLDAGIDQVLDTFLLLKKTTFASIEDVGERQIFELGRKFGFYLLNDFSGFTYTFLGNFTNLRAETSLWRIRLLNELWNERIKSVPDRIKLGVASKEMIPLLVEVLSKMQIWVIVNSKIEKEKINNELISNPVNFHYEIFTSEEVRNEVEKYL